MKKFLSMLLCLLCILGTAACNPGSTEESSDTSQDQSTASEPDNTQVDKPSYFSGISADRTIGKTNVLSGKTYTYSMSSGSNDLYVDRDMTLLTDDDEPANFHKDKWVGFVGVTALNIVLDLGEVMDGLADFELGTLRQLDYAIGLPGNVAFSISTDGENYDKIATLMPPTDIGETSKYTYAVKMQETVSARYIKISVSSPESGFIFIDEAKCYVYDGEPIDTEAPVESDPGMEYYGTDTYPVGDPVYWDSSDPDYNNEINLALGADVYISSFSSIPEENRTPGSNTPIENAGILNDGVKDAKASWDDSTVFRCTLGQARAIIFDLGKISAVSSFKGQMITHIPWGVAAPSEMGVSISEDGINWLGVGTASITYDRNIENQFLNFGDEFDATYKARYIKFNVRVKNFTAITELEVYGTKSIPADAVSPSDAEGTHTRLYDDYPDGDAVLDGVENVMLAAICREKNGAYDEEAMITAEEFLPYVGYYEGDQLKDTFMDTFLFSPASGFASTEDMLTLKGWQYYIDSQFVEDRNLNALSDAVKTVGDELELEDYKVNIFMSIIRTNPVNSTGGVNTFGDIDGDGIDESLDNIENRKKVSKWMVDKQLELYNAQNYGNFNLVGFYWQEECIDYNWTTHDPQVPLDDIEVLKYTVDYVHSLGYKIMWIPYFEAYGFQNWQDYGFDLVCMQPNYSFMTEPNVQRLEETALLAKMFGMCVELEISYYTSRENITMYKQYLEYGARLGYMDSVKIYYHGLIPSDVTLAKDSDDAYTSSVYKDTYMYAKGLIDENYFGDSLSEFQAAEDMSVTVAKNGTLESRVEFTSAESHEFIIAQSPMYGIFRLNLDGSFYYKPPMGFTGKDSFSVRISYLGGESEEIKIDITVTE